MNLLTSSTDTVLKTACSLKQFYNASMISHTIAHYEKYRYVTLKTIAFLDISCPMVNSCTQ